MNCSQERQPPRNLPEDGSGNRDVRRVQSPGPQKERVWRVLRLGQKPPKKAGAGDHARFPVLT